MVKVVEPPITSSEVRIVLTCGSFRSRWWNGGDGERASLPQDPERKATTASGCVIVTVNLSKRDTSDAPYLSRAYICMTIDGIETLTAVTAILSRWVMSSNFLRCSPRVFRYIGKDDIAATPFTFAESCVRSHSTMNAGGPAAMKSTAPERSASFITAGPPRSIHWTCRFWMPDSWACRSMMEYFSMTRSGRKPTPPAPRGMRIWPVSAPVVAGGLEHEVISTRHMRTAPAINLIP